MYNIGSIYTKLENFAKLSFLFLTFVDLVFLSHN